MADPVREDLESLALTADELKSMTDWPEAMIEEWLNFVNNFAALAQGVDSKTVEGTEDQIISEDSESGGVILSLPDPLVTPGDLHVTGKLVLSEESGLPYGSLYAKGASITVDISGAGQGVFVKITGLTTGLLNNVTVSSNAFNVATVGVYKVDWQVSAYSATGKVYQFSIFRNTFEQSDGSAQMRIENDTAGQEHIFSGTGLINITNVGQAIDLRVEQVNAGPSDLTLTNVNFNITQ
jgi:hypothetical protein